MFQVIKKLFFFGCKFYGALKRLCVRLAIAVLILTDTLAKGKELSREGTICNCMIPRANFGVTNKDCLELGCLPACLPVIWHRI